MRTKVHEGGGKRPNWNQSFDFTITSTSDDIVFRVMDDDVTTSDLVGQTTIKCSSLCINNGVNEWFTINYKDKSAGRVHIASRFNPANKPADPNKPAAGQQMPAGYPPGYMMPGMAMPGMPMQVPVAVPMMGQYPPGYAVP